MQLLIVLFIGLLLNNVVSAKAPFAGKILMAIGDVAIADKQLKRRSKVFKEDIIVVGANSSAQVKFIDGTLLNIHANSKINLNDYNFKPESPEDNSFKLNVITGAIKVATGELASTSPDKFELSTDLMTIGVRGTVVAVSAAEVEQFVVAIQGAIMTNFASGKVVATSSKSIQNAVKVKIPGGLASQSGSSTVSSIDIEVTLTDGSTVMNTVFFTSTTQTDGSVTSISAQTTDSQGNTVTSTLAAGSSPDSATVTSTTTDSNTGSSSTDSTTLASFTSSSGVSTVATTPVTLLPIVPTTSAGGTSSTITVGGVNVTTRGSTPGTITPTAATSIYTHTDLNDMHNDFYDFIKPSGGSPKPASSWTMNGAYFGAYKHIRNTMKVQFYDAANETRPVFINQTSNYGIFDTGQPNRAITNPNQFWYMLAPDVSYRNAANTADLSPANVDVQVGDELKQVKFSIDDDDVYYGYWKNSHSTTHTGGANENYHQGGGYFNSTIGAPGLTSGSQFVNNEERSPSNWQWWYATELEYTALPNSGSVIYDQIVAFDALLTSGSTVLNTFSTEHVNSFNLEVDFGIKQYKWGMDIEKGADRYIINQATFSGGPTVYVHDVRYGFDEISHNFGEHRNGTLSANGTDYGTSVNVGGHLNDTNAVGVFLLQSGVGNMHGFFSLTTTP